MTVLVATVCLGYLDRRTFNINLRQPQYQEVDGSVAHAAYAPLQSDITTAVSLGATITRVAGGWWATGYIWRCIFVAMERGGISAKGLSQAISNRPPAPRHFTRKSNMVIIYIALFTTFAIDYFSAALTGSFIWETADTRIPGKIPLSRITDGTLSKSEYESYDLPDFMNDTNLVAFQSQIIMMASASASIAWGTSQSNSTPNITEPSTTFRRVINGVQYISTHSTLAKVTIPYFAVDAFEWVRDPHQHLTDKQLSFLDRNASGYNPFEIIIANGTGGLLPDEEWGYGPMTPASGDLPMPISETRPFTFRIWASLPAITCPKNYTINPGSEVNLISRRYREGVDCFAIANVSYRAGVITCQNCTIISPNVVEAQVPFSLVGNEFTSQALGITPYLAANLFLPNYAIPLDYGTNRNLAIELTSRAYQAAWATLVEYFSGNTNNSATVQIAVPTLRAKVIHWRVYLWVALHLWVLALGLLFTYIQSHCDHPWVEDPTMAVFWLDTRAVFTKLDGQFAWDSWQLGTVIHEDPVLILEQNEAGQRSVQVKRSSGLCQRRYSDSIPLRRRMPPSSSTIPEEESRESVETLIGTSVPTGLHSLSLPDSTRSLEVSVE